MRPSVSAIIFFAASQLSAVELSSVEQASQNFSFGKIHIGMTLKKFQQSFPDAQADENYSEPRIGTLTFNLPPVPTPERPDTISVRFYQEKVYEVMKILRTETLSKIGGRAVIKKKMKSKFGAAHYVSENLDIRRAEFQSWQFPKVHRSVKYIYDGTYEVASIIVTDTDVDKKVDFAVAQLEAAEETPNVSKVDLEF